MSKSLIFETLNDVKTLDCKKSSDGLMHLSGVFGVCGVKNNNQRIYEKSNYAKMVKMLQERINNEGCPGELEHPNSMNINLENISHKIESIDIDENGVVSGTITLLNTPKGKIAQAIVEGGLPLFISSRARGNVSKEGFVTLEELKTYDLVGTPGFSQAKMHLNEGQVAESICESCFYINEEDNDEKNQDNEMNEQLTEQINALTEKVKELEESLAERPTVEEIANGVQKWITEEYDVENRKWINETLIPQFKNELVSQIAEGTEKWVANEVSQVFEKWVTEEFAPEVEKWIVEEYSPEVEKWITEEYSGKLQEWIIEQYSPEIQNWMINEMAPEIQTWVDNKITESINEATNESKKNELDEIDNLIRVIESAGEKPKYSRKAILESKTNSDEPKYIQEMPAEKRAQWDMASDDIKETVMRRAKLYNLVNEQAIANFWEKVDFSTIKPTETVLENANDIQDEWEKNIRMRLRARR